MSSLFYVLVVLSVCSVVVFGETDLQNFAQNLIQLYVISYIFYIVFIHSFIYFIISRLNPNGANSQPNELLLQLTNGLFE